MPGRRDRPSVFSIRSLRRWILPRSRSALRLRDPGHGYKRHVVESHLEESERTSLLWRGSARDCLQLYPQRVPRSTRLLLLHQLWGDKTAEIAVAPSTASGIIVKAVSQARTCFALPLSAAMAAPVLGCVVERRDGRGATAQAATAAANRSEERR